MPITCVLTRTSTSGGGVSFGPLRHPLKAVVGLGSTELTSSFPEHLHFSEIFPQLGDTLARTCVARDAVGGIAIASRRGLGRVKHIRNNRL